MSEPIENQSPLRFDANGLIPAVIQDAQSSDLLMIGFMNQAALDATRATKRTHFWSRSRGKLWKKGETSGHEQIVEEIRVNCELNSLLILVQQVGAVCHDGYPTCFYRRLEVDNSLITIKERWFDPAEVYQHNDGESLESRSRRWYDAYAYLRDHDLASVSGTSKRLHDPQAQIHNRIADELTELAGVLTGEHRHADLASDVLLEGSQSLYWLALLAVQAGVSWETLRPDRALITSDDAVSSESAARLLIGEALFWSHGPGDPANVGARCHVAMALVAQACRAARVSPSSLIRRDLAELEQKPYLAPYFAAGGGEPS